MLLVQPLDRTGQPEGRTLVAADATRMAGPGELVYYEGGREAALALDPWFVPVDHAIIGIVDELHRVATTARARAVTRNAMIVGTVTGTIHSTINHPFYDAKQLAARRAGGRVGQPTGAYLIAVDTVDAGVGERVLVLDEGNGRASGPRIDRWPGPVGHRRHRRRGSRSLAGLPERSRRERARPATRDENQRGGHCESKDVTAEAVGSGSRQDPNLEP